MSRHFFSRRKGGWNRLHRSLRADASLVLCLDYDGTLVPIRKKPALAILSKALRILLRRLANRRNTHVGIVTGRSLSDILRKVHLTELFYIANHGFEIQMSNLFWVHPDAKAATRKLKKLIPDLRKILKAFPGALLENKGLTISVHYRNVRGAARWKLQERVQKVVKQNEEGLRIVKGKKVVEIRPDVEWGKGRAVLEALKLFDLQKKPALLYIGDDTTDEDAFKYLRSKGMTVRVRNSGKSYAEYFVSGTSDVERILSSIDLLPQERDSQ